MLRRISKLKSKSNLGTKRGLPRRSEKKAAWFREQRAPFVADFLSRNPWCAFVLWTMPTVIEESPRLGTVTRNVSRCTNRADDVHEIEPQGRGGVAIPVDGDESNFLPLCRLHHIWVTSNPKHARRLGYTR